MALMAKFKPKSDFLDNLKLHRWVRTQLQAAMWLMTHALKDPEQAGAVSTRS